MLLKILYLIFIIYMSIIPTLFLFVTFTGCFAELFPKSRISSKIKLFWGNASTEERDGWLDVLMRTLYPYLKY